MGDTINEAIIMVVDDDAAIRDSLVEFIDMAGYNSLSADSGESALELLKTKAIDVIITDILLPGIDGLELCEVVKKNYDTDVIVTTGYSGDYSYEEAVRRGASDFVFKPVRFEELLLRMRRTLKDRKLTFERISMLEKMKNTLMIYRDKYGENDVNRIVKTIEFPEEYFQAGVSILNYFGQILKRRYPGKNARFSIEQDGLTVKMVIVTPEGEKDVVERILNKYGCVITGKTSVEELTNDPILALELRNELRLAKVRIESQKEIIAYQNVSLNQLNKVLEQAIISKPEKIENHVNVIAENRLNCHQEIELFPIISLMHKELQELAKQLDEHSKEKLLIYELINATIELKQIKSKDQINQSSAISKIAKFIDNIQKAETLAGKAINTAKNGFDIGRKLASYYNEIAQWCGLPQVPKPLVKK